MHLPLPKRQAGLLGTSLWVADHGHNYQSCAQTSPDSKIPSHSSGKLSDQCSVWHLRVAGESEANCNILRKITYYYQEGFTGSDHKKKERKQYNQIILTGCWQQLIVPVSREKLPETYICEGQETARLVPFLSKQLYLQPAAIAISLLSPQAI